MNDDIRLDGNNPTNQTIAYFNQTNTTISSTIDSITTTTTTTTINATSGTNTNTSYTGTRPKTNAHTTANFNTSDASTLHANDANDFTNNVHRPTGINIERLFYHRPNIPLLEGYRGNVWTGIRPELWVSLLNDLFRDEHIFTDIEKLATYPRFLEPNGSARFIIDSSVDLKNAQTWVEFSNNLLNILSPLTTESCFEMFSQFKNLNWKKDTVFQVFASQIQASLNNFEKNAITYFNASFSPMMRKLMIFGTIYSCVPNEYKNKMVEYFEADLSYPEQVRRYMAKTANELNMPFKNNTANENKTLRENSVSNIQSYNRRENLNNINSQANFVSNLDRYKNKTNVQQFINPETTPKCFRCERWCHDTSECTYSPFCSLCKDYHLRGSFPQCLNTTWNHLSPQSSQRIKFLSPNRNVSQRYTNQNLLNQYDDRRSRNMSRNRNFNNNYNQSQQQPMHYNHNTRNNAFQNKNAFQKQNNSFRNRQQIHCVQENNFTHNMQPTEYFNENTSNYNNDDFSLKHNIPRPQSPCYFNNNDSLESESHKHTSVNTEHFSHYIEVDYESDVDELDYITCNSNSSYTDANTSLYCNNTDANTSLYRNDSSTRNSKLAYEAINSKPHKTLNNLFGIPTNITHNHSYTHSSTNFIDTGSMKSLLKLSLFTKLCNFSNSNDAPVLRKTNIVLKSISGNKLLVYGKTTLKLIIRNIPFICDFIVVEDSCCTFPKEVLIGCDILTRIPLILDYHAQTAYLKVEGELRPLPLLPITNNHFNSSENAQQIQKTHTQPQKQKQMLNQPPYIPKDINSITKNKSQITESSEYFLNAKIESFQNELQELKTRFDKFTSLTNNSSFENRSQNINTTSYHDTNTNPILDLKNNVLDNETNPVNSDTSLILDDETNSIHSDTSLILTTTSPIEITENDKNFKDSSFVNDTTTFSSDLYDEQTPTNFKENHSNTCLKSYLLQNIQNSANNSNKKVHFQIDSSSDTVNNNRSCFRGDNRKLLGDYNQYSNTSSQAFSRKENTTKLNSKFRSSKNFYHPQKQNLKFQHSKKFSQHPQILPDSYSYNKTFQNHSNHPQTFQNSYHSQTSKVLPHSQQTFQRSQNNSYHSQTSPKVLPHSQQTFQHSENHSYPQTSSNFDSHSQHTHHHTQNFKQSSQFDSLPNNFPNMSQIINPHISPLRNNNVSPNSSLSPILKDNRQTDPSYRPYPLYKHSQNTFQMKLRSQTKRTQNVQNNSPRRLRSHFK